MKFYFVYEKKNYKNLKNAFFYLKYHNSNKFQYFKLKIQPNTLKKSNFEEKVGTIGYGTV